MDWREKVKENIDMALCIEGFRCHMRYFYKYELYKKHDCKNYPNKCNKCIEVTNKLIHNNAGIYNYLSKIKKKWNRVLIKADDLFDYLSNNIVFLILFSITFFCGYLLNYYLLH